MPKPEIIQDGQPNGLSRVFVTAKNDKCTVSPGCKMSKQVSVRAVGSKLNNLQLTRACVCPDHRSFIVYLLGGRDIKLVAFQERDQKALKVIRRIRPDRDLPGDANDEHSSQKEPKGT
jgi:hypothetical protein